MEINRKKIGRIAVAACAATALVAVSALVASGAAVGAITEGFKAAGNTAKNILKESKPEHDTAPEQTPVPPAERAEEMEENQSFMGGN